MDIVKSVIVGLAILIGFGFAGQTMYWLFRYVAVGRTDRRTRLDELRPRIWNFIRFVLGQGRVIREFAGFLHFFIFWGFLVLQLETGEYFVRAFLPHFRFSALMGETAYSGLLFAQDVAGVVVLVCCAVAAVRRFGVRPDHSMQSTDAAVILGFISALMVSKFLAHGAEIAHAADQAELGFDPAATPVATWLSGLLGDGPFSRPEAGWLGVLYAAMYFTHIGIILFFANYIPRGKHLHLFGAMPNVFFRKLEPNGALYPIDLEDENAESFGAAKLEELTWKQLLDTYACTECGRCEHYCPAFNSGKELNPMMIVHKLKDHIKEKGAKVVRGGQKDEYPPLAGGIISAEELMACTTCGACVNNCPVFVEHVDTIVDMRRYLVLTAAEVAPEVARTFKNIEKNSNPWGVSNSKRGDWAEGLDVPLMSDRETPPEYLFWVGCAGAFDDRQKKVTIAMARILKAVGIDFAILGAEEQCTGDAARRIGNEYLYHSMATANIETLNGYKVKKILTTCPHCLHTIGREYPQLGGNYEVIHHARFLNDLLQARAIRLRDQGTRTIAYHDSCYLGRWNRDYENPREALGQVPGVRIAEAEWNRDRALCCGAGGGRMWMEEHHGARVNVQRTDMLLKAGGDAIVVNCPFCMTMIADGLKQRDSARPALDLAEVIAEAMDEAATRAANSRPESAPGTTAAAE